MLSKVVPFFTVQNDIAGPDCAFLCAFFPLFSLSVPSCGFIPILFIRALATVMCLLQTFITTYGNIYHYFQGLTKA